MGCTMESASSSFQIQAPIPSFPQHAIAPAYDSTVPYFTDFSVDYDCVLFLSIGLGTLFNARDWFRKQALATIFNNRTIASVFWALTICIRHCTEYFIEIISFNLHSNLRNKDPFAVEERG